MKVALTLLKDQPGHKVLF